MKSWKGLSDTVLRLSLIHIFGGCGLYFICVMGPFDMSVGANIVLSSIIACNASVRFGYAGLIIAPILCGTLIGLINGLVYIKLHISSLIVTVALSLIYEALSVYATNGKNVILDINFRAFGDYPANLILEMCIRDRDTACASRRLRTFRNGFSDGDRARNQ